MKRAIDASTTVHAALARTRKVLLDDPGAVIADTCSAGERRARFFRTELAVPMGGGTSIHQEVAVHIGPARTTDHDEAAEPGISLPLRWSPIGRDRLFPTFEGELLALPDPTGTLLRLRGTYTLPLGVVGRFGDGLAGRRLAHRSLVTFVEALARRLDAEVDRRLRSAPRCGARPAVELRELSGDAYLD